MARGGVRFAPPCGVKDSTAMSTALKLLMATLLVLGPGLRVLYALAG